MQPVYIARYIFVFTITASRIAAGQSYTDDGKDLQTTIRSLDSLCGEKQKSGKKVIFMLRFIDFGCQPCLQNFFDLCDSLKAANNNHFTLQVYLLFLKDQTGAGYQEGSMTQWAKSCNLDYPLKLVPQDLFRRYGIGHSSVIITEKDGKIIYTGDIPVSWTLLKNILGEEK